jgi:hypothetical protein
LEGDTTSEGYSAPIALILWEIAPKKGQAPPRGAGDYCKTMLQPAPKSADGNGEVVRESARRAASEKSSPPGDDYAPPRSLRQKNRLTGLFKTSTTTNV